MQNLVFNMHKVNSKDTEMTAVEVAVVSSLTLNTLAATFHSV